MQQQTPSRQATYKKNGAKSPLSGFSKLHLLFLGLLLAVLGTLLVPATSQKATAKKQDVDLFAHNNLDQDRSDQTDQLNVPDLPQPDNSALATTLISDTKTTRSDSKDMADMKADVWNTLQIKPGDNLTRLFKRAGLPEKQLYEFLNKDRERELRKILVGESLSFQIENGELDELIYAKNPLKQFHYSRNDDGVFVRKEMQRQPDIIETYKEAVIRDSLFHSGSTAGMSDAQIMNLAQIFQWDIDFALDIREGDKFRVLYEELYLDGEKLTNGPILAAEFINQGKIYQAVRYVDPTGEAAYYTPDGQSLRKEFLRTPVDFARISSHFNLKRRHPVLNTIRAHKGTDYAAPTGTPIRSAGDGKIVHVGTKGGYGKTVIIQHGERYKTLYAHMHKYGKGMRTGKHVKQGQVIGYVGSTGLASGPHLHYEFYVNGSVRNPVTVNLPKAKSIASTDKTLFQEQTNTTLARMDRHQSEGASMIASNLEESNSSTQ